MKKLFNLLLIILITSVFAYFAYAAVSSVSLDSPADNYWSNSANVSFNCSAIMNDAEPIPANVSLYFGLTSSYSLAFNSTNTSAVANATTTQINVANIADGNYTWTCYAANESGSITKAASNQTFFVDTTVPNTATLNSPIDGNVSSGKNITFNWTVADNLDVNISCNLTIDGSYNLTDGYGVVSGSNGIVTVNNLAESVHWWNVTCWDEAGNSNTSATRNFTVDLSNPSLTLGVSNLTWFTTGTSILLNVTATDSSLSKCDLWGDFNGTFMFNQTVSVTSGSAVNFIGMNLSQGTYKWNVQCNDTLGNQAFASTNRTFYVDLTNPSASVSLSSTSLNTYDTVTITCSASDSQDSSPSSSGPSVSLPDGTVSSDTDGTFSDTSATGTYTVTCTATDASGRTGTTTSTFTVSASSSGSSSSSSSGVVSSNKETHTVNLGLNPITIKISKPADLGIEQVQVIAKSEISNVKFSVEKFSGKPDDVDEANGEVLRYIKIDAPLAKDKIKEAKIKFEVSKNWMDDKDINSEDIVMMKFKDDKWITLSTTEVSADSDTKTFEAVTTGFSYFVITTKTQESAVVQEETKKEEETKPAITPTPEKETEEIAENVQEGSKAWLLILILVLALGIIAALLYTRRDWLMNLMPNRDNDDVNKSLRKKLKKRLK